ncbi:MAG: CoA pyrophosphatase [Gammaproteobacteria bacterium]|uniref:Putative nudix hydrolase YeaB n=1 Tax=Marinobacter nitratireducens TaxID=1137280 RepID=A0A072N252_9GAMM|nr:CoA pyrophosphatase [Marinobacter nitratireducens]KEF31754.1 putative nudix hydrolase YeaB [Marinobacter nitratireducens]TNE70498.1 MAG: CoA pyrophosphatase [Gammaproteobacteria bacterium]
MHDFLAERLAGYAPRQLALDYPEAGILVPITNDDRNPEMIFTLRSANLSTHRGQVAYPGGKRDPGDPSLAATALRETHEEIGLPPEQVNVIAPLSQVMSRYGILVTPYVGVIPADHPLEHNPDEIESVFRVPLSFFLEDRRERTDALNFLNHTFYVPCYRWERYQIWGLSAVVLVDFLNAVYDAGIDLLEPPGGG